MSFKASLFGAALALSSMSTAYATTVQLVTNGGFETGDFTGWTAVSNGVAGGCGTNLWVVNSTGTHGCTNFGTAVAAPVIGTYAAFNTFDGGAVNYTLSQKITVPTRFSALTLSFLDEFHMNYSGAVRSLTVGFYDEAGTTLLGDVFFQTAGYSANQWWVGQEVVSVGYLLASQAGKTINLRFTEVIPEAFTGPGGFGLDDISLTATGVPEPGTIALMGLGMMGLAGLRRKRKNG